MRKLVQNDSKRNAAAVDLAAFSGFTAAWLSRAATDPPDPAANRRAKRRRRRRSKEILARREERASARRERIRRRNRSTRPVPGALAAAPRGVTYHRYIDARGIECVDVTGTSVDWWCDQFREGMAQARREQETARIRAAMRSATESRAARRPTPAPRARAGARRAVRVAVRATAARTGPPPAAPSPADDPPSGTALAPRGGAR